MIRKHNKCHVPGGVVWCFACVIRGGCGLWASGRCWLEDTQERAHVVIGIETLFVVVSKEIFLRGWCLWIVVGGEELVGYTFRTWWAGPHHGAEAKSRCFNG